jgi:cytochrome c oxidase cbb3-type subunit 4
MTWQDISDLAKHMWPAWLMVVFLGIAFYAFRPKNKQLFEDCSRIPFRSDDDVELKHAIGVKSGEFLDND